MNIGYAGTSSDFLIVEGVQGSDINQIGINDVINDSISTYTALSSQQYDNEGVLYGTNLFKFYFPWRMGRSLAHLPLRFGLIPSNTSHSRPIQTTGHH